jgi:hypothetical protein
MNSNVWLGRAPRLPQQPLYARFPARSCRSGDGRYPPDCDVHGRDPQCPVNVDFVEEPCLKAIMMCVRGAASEAKRRLFASQGEGWLREGDEFRQFPQILGGGGQ